MEFSNSATKKQKEEMLEIERKAREGDAVSNMILFQRYRDGNVVLRDIKKSFEYLEVAVSKHYAPAEYDLGYLYYSGENGHPIDYNKAAQMYKRAAAQNNSNALNNLGVHYTYGLLDAIEIDYKKALACTFKAAKSGLNVAQRSLGLSYYHGEGTAQNYKKAIEWFTRAIKNGDNSAYYDLGKCYYYGHGVEKDIDRAFLLMSRAAIGGDRDGKKALKFHKQAYTNKDIKLKYPDIMTMDFHLNDYPDEFDDDIEDIKFSKEELEDPNYTEKKAELPKGKKSLEAEESKQGIIGKVIEFFKKEKEKMFGINKIKMHELALPEEIKQDANAREFLRVINTGTGSCEFVIGSPLFAKSAAWGILLADLVRKVSDIYAQEDGVDKAQVARQIVEVLSAEINSPTE